MRVDIIFHTSSTPKIVEATAVYVRPGVLCVELPDGLITMYPLCGVFSWSYKHQPHRGTTKAAEAERKGSG